MRLRAGTTTFVATIDFRPQRPHHLLAVYGDRATAEDLAQRLKREFGLSATINNHNDERTSLNAEMRAEIEDSFLAPQAGVIYSKEAAKGLVLWTVIGCALGLAVAVPTMLFVDFGLTRLAKIATGIGVGLAFGGTLGLVLGGLAAKRPTERLAAEEGVTLRVPADDDALRTMLAEAEPIRIDVVDDQGRPLETVTTNEKRTPREAGRKLGDRMSHWP